MLIEGFSEIIIKFAVKYTTGIEISDDLFMSYVYS